MKIYPNLNHTGSIPITTDRLVLRPFVIQDDAAMYRNWASDPEVTRFLRWQPHADVSVSHAVLCDWIAQYQNPAWYQWAIVPKPDTDLAMEDGAAQRGEPIGTIGAVDMNEITGCVHIGYALGQQYLHHGIMSEALLAVIAHFFDTVGMQRIESMHDPDNPHSGDVMRKCGMTYEGTHRMADYSNRGIVDACYYSILCTEWKGRN